MIWFRHLKTLLIRLLEIILIGLMAALVLDVLWQVFSRYVLQSPSSWTDEAATLLLIWVALLGASVAFMKQSHLGLDYFVQKLPPAWNRHAQLFSHLMVATFAFCVLILGGLKLAQLTLLTEQVSPALGIKMGHVYLALPVSGLFIALFSLESALEILLPPTSSSSKPDKS